MKVALDEITMLSSSDNTLAMDADTARVAYDLARHVLGRVARAPRRR